MHLAGNILWFVCWGWYTGLFYLLGAVVFFPLLPLLLPLVGYAFCPFGKAPVRRSAINQWKENKGEAAETDGFDSAGATIRFLANVVWTLTFGWVLALLHILLGLANAVACLTLLAIPFCLPSAMAHFKLVPVAFRPFGVKIVPSALANEIKVSIAASRL